MSKFSFQFLRKAVTPAKTQAKYFPSGLIMEQLPCPYASCGRFFTTNYNRKKHVEACHLMLRPYMCPLCHKTFPYKHSLDYHMKLHKRIERAGRETEIADAIRMLGRVLGGLGRGNIGEKEWDEGTGIATGQLFVSEKDD